ncbi:MAG: sugar phosphate isomerase/epimerase family protein [Armatimonadota bacterium]
MYFAGIADESGPSIEKQIAAHQQLGWSHIEIRLINGKNLTDVDDATFEHVFNAVQAAGLTVCCFASQLANWSRPITTDFEVDVQELTRAIPRMQRMGTEFIRCMSYPNADWEEEAWRDEVVRRLRILAKMAEDGGILLLHENCNGWGGESPENSLELLERVDNPAFKLLFDTGNPFTHGQNAYEYLAKTIEHTLHVHIKDGNKVDGKDVFSYPGEGVNRVGDCIRLLIDHGYDGGYSIEPHLASVVHTGDIGGEERAQLMWDSYVEYGNRLMRLYQEAGVGAGA